MTWSAWYQLDSADAPVPARAGIYRLRCRGEHGLIYIGFSDRLRSRPGGLRRARHRQDKKGHYAAACVAAFEQQCKIVDVSWSTLVGLDRRELIGLEADLITAHRNCTATRHASSAANLSCWLVTGGVPQARCALIHGGRVGCERGPELAALLADSVPQVRPTARSFLRCQPERRRFRGQPWAS